MSLILNESVVLAKTRSQDLKSVLKLNCWRSGIKDVSLVRQLVNVEVIGLSCNEITTLEDFAYCHKLRELILRQNKISNIAEVAHLQNLTKLTNLWLDENPCVENTHNYRKVVLKALPNLTVLDNKPVTKEELQEIEELGNDIYEEIHYEGSAASNSDPSSTNVPSCSSIPEQTAALAVAPKQIADNNNLQPTLTQDDFPITPNNGLGASVEYSANDFSYQNPSEQLRDTNYLVNESRISMSTGNMNCNNFNATNNSNKSRGSCVNQQSRGLQSYDTSLNGSQHFNCSISNNNNNNNNIGSAKGSKNRNPNILSAVLCLIKELDYFSCEVVQNALHCRMEETSE